MNERAGVRPGDLPRSGLAAIAVAGTLSLVAACGGPSSAGGSAAYQKAVAYAQCMRSHGEPGFPSPTSTGTFSLGQIDIGSQAYQTATQACQNLLPNSAQFQISAAQRQAFLDRALRNAECMRAHGITNFPDPNPNSLAVHGGEINISMSGSGVSGGEIHAEMNSPQGQAALKACAPPGAHLIGPQQR